MRLLYEGQVRKLRTAVAGELLLVEARRTLTFAIALAVQPPRTVLLGFLGPLDGGNTWPFNINWDASGPCVSFGSDWILEPKGTFMAPAAAHHRGSPPNGLVAVGSEGTTIFFGGSRGESGAPAMTFNLSTNAVMPADHQPDGVGFMAWDIWASVQSRQDLRDQPLISFAGALAEA
ncbi:MAG: hypothetical protein AB7O56_13080 [Bauldia sp.]